MHGDWCSLTMERLGVKHVIYPSPLHHYCNSCCWCTVRLENENFHQRICKFETLTGYLLYHVSWWWCEPCHCSFASKDRWDSGGGCSHPVLMHLLLRQIMMGRSLELRKKSPPLSLSSVSARVDALVGRWSSAMWSLSCSLSTLWISFLDFIFFAWIF